MEQTLAWHGPFFLLLSSHGARPPAVASVPRRCIGQRVPAPVSVRETMTSPARWTRLENKFLAQNWAQLLVQAAEPLNAGRPLAAKWKMAYFRILL
ncbi:hypothetical protein BDW62DRAFT_43473 [Aspergillus aurantiobrunneus]